MNLTKILHSISTLYNKFEDKDQDQDQERPEAGVTSVSPLSLTARSLSGVLTLGSSRTLVPPSLRALGSLVPPCLRVF